MKHVQLSDALYHYMVDVSVNEHPVMRQLRDDFAHHQLVGMQIAPEQAQFMQFLLQLTGAKRVLELGTFLGYSALSMALALPDDGELITCDINNEWTKDASHYWKQAGVYHKIKLKLAPALETLEALVLSNQERSFDFIFIDADKTNYLPYYEYALKLIKPKGLIAIDNIFWEGKVVDETQNGAQVREIRKLNALLKSDTRIKKSLVPIADGLFLIQLNTA